MVDAVAVRQELAMLGRVPDDRIPLVEAALLFAALDRPVPSLEPYRAEIAAMERIVRAQTEDLPEVGLSACMDALRAAIIDHGNFSGDVETYDDPDNANLIRVIERRKGLPIALGLMCIHLGDSMGGIVQGLTFPGHFLVRIAAQGQRAILDPFHGLERLSPVRMRALLKAVMGQGAEMAPADYEAVSRRSVLYRLQNNIKTRRLEAGDIPGAIAILKELLVFAPQESAFWREMGMMQLRMGALGDAVDSLEGYLRVDPDANDRDRIYQVVRRLRERLT